MTKPNEKKMKMTLVKVFDSYGNTYYRFIDGYLNIIGKYIMPYGFHNRLKGIERDDMKHTIKLGILHQGDNKEINRIRRKIKRDLEAIQ